MRYHAHLLVVVIPTDRPPTRLQVLCAARLAASAKKSAIFSRANSNDVELLSPTADGGLERAAHAIICPAPRRASDVDDSGLDAEMLGSDAGGDSTDIGRGWDSGPAEGQRAAAGLRPCAASSVLATFGAAAS